MAIPDLSEVNSLPLDDRELFRQLFNTSQMGITIHSPEQGWLEINDAFCNMLGYTSEELYSLDFRDIIHPDDYETNLKQHQRILAGEIDNFSGDNRYYCRDGKILYTHLTINGVRKGDGSVKYCIAFVRDISEQKNTELALIESEKKYRTIVDTTSEWIWEIDRDGRHTYSNPGVEKILGYRQEDIIGRDSFTIMMEADREKVKQLFLESVRNKRGWRGMEIHWRHKNGEARILESNANPILDNKGELLGFRGSDRDITKRKVAEVNAAESRRFIDSLLQSANAMIIALDNSGAVRIFNPAAEKITGYTREEVLGRNWFELLVPSRKYPHVKKEFNSLLSGAGEREFINPVITKDNEERIITWRNTVIEGGGKVSGTISIGIDITESEQNKEALQESKLRLQNILDSLFTFVGLLSTEGVLLEANRAPLERASLTREDVIGKPFPETYWWSYSTEVQDRLREAMHRAAAGENVRYDECVRLGEEHFIVIDFALGPLIDSQGRVVQLIGSAVDITQRKQVEEALRIRSLLDSAISEIGQLALQSRDLYHLMNLIVKNLAASLGVEYTKILEFFPETDDLVLRAGVGWNEGLVGEARIGAERDSQAGYTLLSRGPIIVEDLNVETRFSGPSLLLDHGVVSGMSVIIAGKNRPWGVLGVHTAEHRLFSREDVEFLNVIANILADAIERLRAENEVRRFKDIVDTSDDAISFIDSNYRYLAVNQELMQLTHRQREEIIGHSVAEILGEDYFNKEVKQYIDRCLNGETIHLLSEYKTNEEDSVFLDIHYNPYREEDGNISGVVFISRDVTDQKKAEEQVQRYQHIVDSSDDMVVFVDNNYIYQAVNRKFLEIFRLYKEEVVGRTVSEVFGDEFFNSIKLNFDRCLAGGSFYELTWGKTPRVKDIYMHVAYNPYRGPEGTLKGVVISIRDITDSKEAEEEIRQYKDIVESSEDMIAYIDKQYFYQVVNEPYLEFAGLPRNKVVGHRIEDVMGRDYFYEKGAKANVDKCLNGETVHVQRWYGYPDGNQKCMDVNLTPYRDGTGNITGIVLCGRNVTEQKNLQEALQISTGQLREAQHIVRMGFWLFDNVNNIHTWSDEVYDIFGVDRNSFKVEFGEISKLIHPDDRSRIVSSNASDGGEQDRIEQEYRIIRPDTGEIRYIQGIRKITRDEHGKVTGRFGTVMDITERKETEENIRLSRERLRNLAARLQAIREEERTLIAREIHDELGQALTGLRLDLSWLKKRLPKHWKALPDRIGAMITEVDNHIDYVRNLSSSIRPAMLDDLGLGAAIEWQVQGFSARTGCEYSLDISPFDFSSNYELETAVFRIFQEALNNIARHADADHIEVSMPGDGDDLVLSIRDNGVGITETQLSNPHSIGIIGMQERAGAYGGTVRVQRLNEGGTQVTVSIPYRNGGMVL